MLFILYYPIEKHTFRRLQDLRSLYHLLSSSILAVKMPHSMRTIITKKNIAFPSWHFYVNEDQPPSKLMLFTLETCRRWEVLKPLVPYGPVDIHGSLNGLLNRKLIGIRKVSLRNDSCLTWFVTDRGKSLLKLIA